VAARAAQAAEILTPAQALAFVERHGIVCEAARRGEIRSLADAIAGESIRGNWWGHHQGKRIFALTRAVRAAAEILVCRLVDGKITLVHQRLWPALVRVADSLPRERLARIVEAHGADGKHAVEESPFPAWVPQNVVERAGKLDIAGARDLLRALGEFDA
jgi:hypothetical protein